MVYRISRHIHLRIDDAKAVPQFWSAPWWVVLENHSITSCSIIFHHAIISSLRHARFIVHFVHYVHYKELLRSLLHRQADFLLMSKLNILIPAFLRLLINGASDVTFFKHLQLQSLSFLRQPSLSLMFADQQSLTSHVSQMSESHWLEICIEVAGPVTIEKSEHVLCHLMPIAVPCQSYAWY